MKELEEIDAERKINKENEILKHQEECEEQEGCDSIENRTKQPGRVDFGGKTKGWNRRINKRTERGDVANGKKYIDDDRLDLSREHELYNRYKRYIMYIFPDELISSNGLRVLNDTLLKFLV